VTEQLLDPILLQKNLAGDDRVAQGYLRRPSPSIGAPPRKVSELHPSQ